MNVIFPNQFGPMDYTKRVALKDLIKKGVDSRSMG